MTKITDTRVKAAISLYTKLLLSIYDWVVLGYNFRINWNCPTNHLEKYLTESEVWVLGSEALFRARK